MPDLTWNGISIIGAIDVSGQYQQYGAPYVGNIYGPSSIIVPQSRSPQWLFAPNQAIQSYIGIKVDRPLTSDLKFIARAEMGFNPTTGDITDAIKSAQKSNGIPLASQNVSGDGGRAGQILNGEAWVGFDSKSWGAIHVGRNNALALDMIFAYDPLASYGFSLFGFNGIMGGQGSAETLRIDASVKYLDTFGPFHTEIMFGAPNTDVESFLQGTIGIVQPNFSIDVLGGHTSDSVFASSLAGPANFGSPFLGARIFDSDMYGVFGKYVFGLGGNGPLSTSESKFTVSGGYTRLIMMNPEDGGYAPGHVTIGGYQLGPVLSTNGSFGSGIVNYAFTGGDRKVDTAFIAGKYQYDSQLSFAMAYYLYYTNSFGQGVNSIPGIVAPSYSNTKCSSSAFSNCAGLEQVASFRADYQWTKNIMIYGGLTYSKVSDGLAFSYIKTSTYTTTAGVRYTF
jgi:predicted porin